MQAAWAGSGKTARLVELPDAFEEVLPGVGWGTPDALGTPAYWAVRCRWGAEATPTYSGDGSTLMEQVGFCLLGGFGVRYEAAAAAFARLKDAGAFEPGEAIGEASLRTLLLEPLDVGGRAQRYRFPNQRASRLAAMRMRFAEGGLDGLGALALRDALMAFEGVGPKTASWIVRNHLDSDEVAIIDVHVIRACRSMKVFGPAFRLPRDYTDLEDRFLRLADGIGIRPSVLDAVMWSEVRTWPH